MLDLPQSEPFNPEQEKPVFDWLMHASSQVKAWTPDLLNLLRRIVHDRRWRSPMFFYQIFEGNPDVIRALMPDILEMLATEGVGPYYTPARLAAYTFPRLDPSYLRPYAGKFVSLLDRDPRTRELLLPAVGRIGIDPLPFLLPFSDDLGDDPGAKFARIEGACFAEKQWAPELIHALREAFRSNPTTSPVDRERLSRMLLALQNLGDQEFVAQELATNVSLDSVRSRLNVIIDRPTPDRQPDALCSARI